MQEIFKIKKPLVRAALIIHTRFDHHFLIRRSESAGMGCFILAYSFS